MLASALGVTSTGCGDRRVEVEAKPERASASSYDVVLAELDGRIEAARQLASEHDGWADHELVATLYVQRARLTGSIADWSAADAALHAGFAVAPEGGGPVLTRIELDLSLHRLEDAEAGIARAQAAAVPNERLRQRLATAQAELASQRGQLDEAERGYRRAAELGADPGVTAAQLGLLDARRGEFERAAEHLRAAWDDAASPVGRHAAWLLLQAGLLEWEQGRARAALAKYDEAAAALPGWWLITEHRAEALVALGREREAEALYREVVGATGHPEFMDALAERLLARGEAEKAERWIAAAGREHDRRIAALPRAATAHALDHWIRFEPDDPRTLERARAEAERAPNEANLVRLAEAALASRRIDEAREALARARATGAKTRDLDRLAAELGHANDPNLADQP